MELVDSEVNFSVRKDVVATATQVMFNNLSNDDLSPMEMALVMRSLFEYCRAKMAESSPETPALIFDSLIGSAIFGEKILRKIQAVNFDRENSLLNSVSGGAIH